MQQFPNETWRGRARQVLLALLSFGWLAVLIPSALHDDKTAVWRRAGLAREVVVRIVSAGGVPSPKYALLAGSRGVYRSDDDGQTWWPVSSNLPSEGARNIAVQAVAADCTNPLVLYAGMSGTGSRDPAQSAGLYMTDDGGKTWSSAARDVMVGQEVHSIAIGPCRQISGAATEVVTGDGGEGKAVPTSAASERWVCAATAGSVFCGTGRDRSWVRLNWRGADVRVLTMAISPDNPSGLYVGTNGLGLYVTQDGGSSWKQHLQGRRVFDVVVPSAEPNHVYVATDQGIFKSMDGGSVWTQLDGPTRGRRVNAIVLNPENEAVLYAGLQHGAVWYTLDAGTEWAPLKRGMGDLTVLSLVLERRNRPVLWAGTTDGVWEYELEESVLAAATGTTISTAMPTSMAVVRLTHTATPTSTPSPLSSPTLTQTATPAVTHTLIPTSTSTPLPSPTPTPTPSPSPLKPTATRVQTPTATSTATAQPLPTEVPVVATETAVPR